mmetsp:Transcript_37298/g.79187  ORF Transcript_37298/g.79187 Transcript_37298/m.79187 type:complete len:139 (-) Transcript_37298:304-720(-)
MPLLSRVVVTLNVLCFSSWGLYVLFQPNCKLDIVSYATALMNLFIAAGSWACMTGEGGGRVQYLGLAMGNAWGWTYFFLNSLNLPIFGDTKECAVEICKASLAGCAVLLLLNMIAFRIHRKSGNEPVSSTEPLLQSGP